MKKGWVSVLAVLAALVVGVGVSVKKMDVCVFSFFHACVFSFFHVCVFSVSAFSEIYGFRNRSFGALQAAGGFAELAGGGAFWESGVGIAVAARGVDDIQAGLRALFTGRPAETVTYQLANAVTGSETAATIVDVGTGLASIGGAASALGRGTRAISRADDLAGSLHHLDDLVVAPKNALLRQKLPGTVVDASGDVLLYMGSQQARARALVKEAARVVGVSAVKSSSESIGDSDFKRSSPPTSHRIGLGYRLRAHGNDSIGRSGR